jgi:predicted extracellular nuclease
MDAKATATATPVSFVKFAKGKTINAIAMTEKETALFETGEELGFATVESEIAWADALKSCKTSQDRLILRAGFVSAYMAARKAKEATAIQAFNRRAREHAPHTSRKAKANAKKKTGRPEKKAGKGEHVPAQDVALRLANVLHYIAKAQAQHAGDSDVLEMLGEIAAIAGGKTK